MTFQPYMPNQEHSASAGSNFSFRAFPWLHVCSRGGSYGYNNLYSSLKVRLAAILRLMYCADIRAKCKA